jgi:outer membrane lipoprotein-sorting protein
MYALVCLILLVVAGSAAQDTQDPRVLLQSAESLVHNPKSWRAEIVETFRILGNGMDLQSQVRIKIAVQAPLKMRRENSGDDQTVLICDGTESFYMGDGHNYYRSSAKANQDCNFPLGASYQLAKDSASASITGHDHVVLADGSHACNVLRVEWKAAAGRGVRTMCIDPTSGIILRDVTDINNESKNMRLVKTATFTSYETNPTFPPETFKFSIPPGAVEAKPPI